MTCQTCIHRLNVALWGCWLATGCRVGLVIRCQLDKHQGPVTFSAGPKASRPLGRAAKGWDGNAVVSAINRNMPVGCACVRLVTTFAELPQHVQDTANKARVTPSDFRGVAMPKGQDFITQDTHSNLANLVATIAWGLGIQHPPRVCASFVILNGPLLHPSDEDRKSLTSLTERSVVEVLTGGTPLEGMLAITAGISTLAGNDGKSKDPEDLADGGMAGCPRISRTSSSAATGSRR